MMRALLLAAVAAPAAGTNFIPTQTHNSAFEQVNVECGDLREAYRAEGCCGNPGKTMHPVMVDGHNCMVEAGSHVAHAEGFSGTKVEALLTASECVHHGHADWQASPHFAAGEFCAFGAFDGLQAMPILGNGSMQTLNTGDTYMRVFINTEITGRSGEDRVRNPEWFISTDDSRGGFGEPAPTAGQRLHMEGALEQFFDLDRRTLEVVNGGHAIKKVYTLHKTPYQHPFSETATSDDLWAIVTEHSHLHQNVMANSDTRHVPDCDATPALCGLSGHCGSKLCLAHEFSYVPKGSGASLVSGVGFEDDVLLIAMEGHPIGDDIYGTVQALDVRTGNLYQLPHLSVGVIEMAFSISTGHPDYIAVGIEEYGVGSCGSRWSVWLGKKETGSSHFLDRNGLGVNSGRIYVFVADDGETDMATFMGWPQSGAADSFTPQAGHLKPIDGMFDGVYRNWTATIVNCMNTTDGSVPLRMTGRSKQEWGSVNPDQPNQWVIAETGLGGSVGGRQRGCEDKTADCPMGTDSSTLAFLEADFLSALNAVGDSSLTARNPAVAMPESISAQLIDVMKDQVYHGPNRDATGFAAGDSVFWLRNGNVVFSEDSRAYGGYNMGSIYNINTRKTVPIVGAIGDDNRKMNQVANVPYGSWDKGRDQEMTGLFDASPALSLSVPFTPQQYYDAMDGKHLIVNNQMKGLRGCMGQGFYYTAQMYLLTLPFIDWDTVVGAPSALNSAAEEHWVTAYGKYRRLGGAGAAAKGKKEASQPRRMQGQPNPNECSFTDGSAPDDDSGCF